VTAAAARGSAYNARDFEVEPRGMHHVVQVALALSLALPCGGGERPAIGATIEDLRFTDMHWLPRSLADFGERKAFALVFTTIDCPIAQRYLPRLIELEARYRERGVQFVAVDVGAGDSILEIATVAAEREIAFPFVKDFDGRVVAALGVERTPEVVVLDGARKLVYRGRIDDQYRLGGEKQQAGRADLASALDDVLAARQVEIAETPVDGCVIGSLAPASPRNDLTWARDIAPIVQAHCQDCHRPGQVAPFSLLTYRDVADHAETIAEVVRQERMPPWFGSPSYGHFTNAPTITAEQRSQLVDWVRNGAAAGDLAHEPAPREFPASPWRIGEPDLVTRQLIGTAIPAEGVIPYEYVILPHVFNEDTWVDRVEINPSNTRCVHHANLGYFKLTEKFSNDNFITGFVPGGDPLVCDPGVALKIPKGSLLGLQVHYVTSGKPENDRISVGLHFPRATVERELRNFQIHNSRFAIPPGAGAHVVKAHATFERDVTGVGMFSHMHLRGRDMTFRATYADGRDETLLVVPNYSFDWQQSYRWSPGAEHFPAGTRIDVLAHFDNTAFNAFNPDPAATVRFSEQTDGEMMYGFFFFTEDAQQLGLDVDPSNGRVRAAPPPK